MKEIKLKGLDEIIYYDQCENGLDIYVWVNKKVNTFKGTITFLVGSEDVEFSIKKKKYQVPYGTAHYLEHILCKNEKGETVLSAFQSYGSYANASTYGYKTVYEFVGTEKLKENINLLLDITQNKEFVEEYFVRERGPILEEARMYKDVPNRVIATEINKCLFHKYPNRVPGIGSLDDIEKINLENLQFLYNSFYHPKNSFVTVTGNVDPMEVIHTIKENQKAKKFLDYANPTMAKYREPKKIVETDKELFLNIEVPKVFLCKKIPKNLFLDYDTVTVLDALQVVLSSNFGVTSLFRDELISKKLVLNLRAVAYTERDFYIIQVESKTKYPDEVIKILREKLETLDITKDDIERKKKAEIATLVLGYEDPESVNDDISYQISKFGKIYDNEKELLENLTFEKIKDIFSRISSKEISVVVALPNQKKDE